MSEYSTSLSDLLDLICIEGMFLSIRAVLVYLTFQTYWRYLSEYSTSPSDLIRPHLFWIEGIYLSIRPGYLTFQILFVLKVFIWVFDQYIWPFRYYSSECIYHLTSLTDLLISFVLKIFIWVFDKSARPSRSSTGRRLGNQVFATGR